MKLGTKFSLTAVCIVFILSLLMEFMSLFVFTRHIRTLNKELFAEKLERLVALAFEQDELYFDGVYKDIKEAQWKVLRHLDGVYRERKSETTYMFIVDTEGKVIIHPDGSRWNKSIPYRLEKNDLMFNAETRALIAGLKDGDFTYSTPQGTERWAVFKTYEPWGWVFCVSTTQELLSKSAFSFMKVSALVSAGMLALTVFCILFLSRRYTEPIYAVIKRLQEIARGDVSRDGASQLQLKSNDEVGMLADAVQKMAQDLAKITVSRDELMKEIAERKRLEHVVLQSEKMAAVGQLAAGVAHEINNPLGVILGFAQGIVKRVNPGDPFEKPALSIEREALRCKQLVKDLLSFSRSSKSEREPMDIAPCVDGALSLVLAQSKVKNVEIIKNIEPDIPRIFANTNQIQQVVINLSNNAIDAMPEGGKLWINTSLHTSPDGKRRVQLEVRDNGKGIPPEVRSKIFDPFFTTKEVGKGTGLGLSLVYEIVERHEGSIEVESHPGAGTAFRILLPIHKA